MANTKKLLNDLNRKIKNWDERSCFTIKGVSNLSMSDIETIMLYAQHYELHGSFFGLMEPRGDIKKVLGAYGIQ